MASLHEDIAQAVALDGLCELIVRVTRYEADLRTPAAWQAIAKYHGAMNGPWGVGVRSCPIAAARAALSERGRVLTAPSESVCHGDIQLHTEDPFA